MATPISALSAGRTRISQSRAWQTLRAATWLEWETRGNWTNPALYLLYLIIRPMTASLVLVLMFWVIKGVGAHDGIYGFLITGSAAWTFVEQIIAGIPQAVLADREEYAMLKYVYITPSHFLLFLTGRALPRMLVAFFSFVVTLGIGIALLGVPVNLLQVNYPLFFASLIVGLVGVTALGILLAGLALVLKRGAYQMPQAVTGALYLISGAIFPITVLPSWLRDVSLALPLTYWLELMRRALLGSHIGESFPVAETGAVFGLLTLTTVVLIGVALVAFRICDFQARERGQIDRTTGY
ncbi:MAG: ABC transporter permease [Ktedonobacterales bacterium]|nr:ABC transporter permease [Ktedonobacterales bacterium]